MNTNKAVKAHEELRRINDAKNRSAIYIGKVLYELRETGGYEAITGEGGTWAAYLADPEVNIAPSTASRYMSAYERLVVGLGIKLQRLEGTDIYKLHLISAVATKDDAEEWLARAETLSRSDLKHLVTHGEVDTVSCKHAYRCHKEKCEKCGDIKNVRK